MKRMLLAMGLAAMMAGMAAAGQGVGIGMSYRDEFPGPMIEYEWMFSKYFGLELRASYLTGSQDADVVQKEQHYQGGRYVRSATITTSGGEIDTDVIPLEAALKIVYPFEKWTPYMLLGGGYYIYDGDIPTYGGPDASPENTPGFFGAAGVELAVNETVVLFLEVQYTQATWESEEDYSGSRREWHGAFAYADYDYTGTQTVEGGLEGVGGIAGLLWKF